jgi:hypothetical protein
MLHKNSRERYEKLKMQFRRLMRNFNHDDLDDFIATANSMPEWMKHDPSLTQEQRDAIARFTVEGSIDWQICHQIANRQKHPKPQRPGGPALQLKSVNINPGAHGFFLQSSLSAPVIGSGEDISVDYSDFQESALAFVIRTLKHFHYMFEVATTPTAQRQTPKLADLVGM